MFDFAPWIVYGVLSALGNGGAGCVGGLIISLLLTIVQWRARRVKILDAATLLYFFAGSIVTVLLHSPMFLNHNAALAWMTFAAVAWVSLLAGAPFTAQYAREIIPQEFWESPAFRRANVVLTSVWGIVFMVNALLAVILDLKTHGMTKYAMVCLQVLPYVGTIFGIVFTNRYSQWARRQRLRDVTVSQKL